jgi:putative membrane protein
LHGTEFDKAYARQQVLAHAQAFAVEDSFANAGSDANLKHAAQAAVTMVQAHLKAAEQLRTSVDKN